ncbi:MAG: hypothetical protein ACI4DS_01910 [Eubacterium sp.]
MRFLRQLILFITGFCLYITIEVCYRGYSYPLMGVCGGIILLILDRINDKISWDMDILLQGCIGSLVTTLFEFVIGSICLILDFNLMWDYSNLPLNFAGIICVPFSLVWIVISIIGIFIADAINYYVFGKMPVPYYKLFGHIILKFKKR